MLLRASQALMIKRRIIYGAIGLLYGVAVGFWAMILSGGGHFNLPMILIISPVWGRFWLGLMFWPIWALMSARFNSLVSKCLFVLTMIAHFGYVVWYLTEEWRTDLHYFELAWQEPIYLPEAIFFPGTVFIAYAAAHGFLWGRFLIDTVGPIAWPSSRSANIAT